MRILIAYGTTEGQTRKIATFLAERFTDQSHIVTLVDASALPPVLDVAACDAVVVAARVHASTYPSSIRRFVRRYRAALTDRPSAFVSVSLMAAMGTPRSADAMAGYVERFSRKTGWSPTMVHHAAGARFYTKHGAFGRWILRMIDSKAWGKQIDTSVDHVWTDWRALGRFGDRFLTAAMPAREVRSAA